MCARAGIVARRSRTPREVAPRADDDPEVERVRALLEARLLGTGCALARLTALELARLLRTRADEELARGTGADDEEDEEA